MSSVLFQHASQVVTVDFAGPENPLGIIPNGAVLVEDGLITWVGTSADCDRLNLTADDVVDCSGRIVMPGLIDSHTHPVFAGDRSDEFEMRLTGKTYLEIAQAGGGIQKTVMATRQASEAWLVEATRRRLETMLSFGVTTVEVKSGYGLDWETEAKCLRVLHQLKQQGPQSLQVTYMGAHDIPLEFKGRTEDYVQQLCEEDLPRVAKTGWADACDVFCEAGYFSVDQSRQILETARDLGLGIKIHAEEFTDLGGAKLAGEMGALSADHLLHIGDDGIEALKQGGTVATLLPGTAFYLRLGYAPARKLLDAGVTVALATDFNPGSCMSENLQLVMTLACLNMNMTPVEVIRAVTINAAKALGLQGDRGSLAVGKRGDVAVFNVASYNELLYHFGVNHLSEVYIAGAKAG